MQENKDFFSADPERTVAKPRFGKKETMQARPVVPLKEQASTHDALDRAPQVGLRAPGWRSMPHSLIVASVLVVAAAIATATALYQRSDRANASDYTQPSASAIEEPSDPQQTSPSQPAPATSSGSAGRDEDRRGGESRRRSSHRTRRVDAIFDVRADEEDESDGDSDGRRRYRGRRAGGDDDRMLRRAQRVERARREVRRLRDIFEH